EHMKMASMKHGAPSIAGMTSGGSSAAAASTGLPLGASITPNPPVVGNNTLDITAVDTNGKPITGLKLSAAVFMTNMDMGTTHPKVTEGRNGHYNTVVNFSMKGPWRVELTSPPGAWTGAVHLALDFSVGSSEKWAQAASERMILNTRPETLKVGKNLLAFT